jgi:hypothetical protein
VIRPSGPTLADCQPPLGRLQETARRQGYRMALESLHREAGPEVLLCGPVGYAIAPRAMAQCACQWRVAGTIMDRVAGVETDVTTVPLSAAGLVALRCGCVPPASPDGHVPWALGLTWLRLGLSGGLLDACLGYLGGRTAGGTPLLKQQLLKGALADAVISHLEIETALAGDTTTLPGLADLHQQITSTDRGLLRLLGASGFVLEGPGRTAYVSEMLADAYIGPAESGASA